MLGYFSATFGILCIFGCSMRVNKGLCFIRKAASLWVLVVVLLVVVVMVVVALFVFV